MKKIVTILLSLFVAAISVDGHRFSPRSSWPYIYEEFKDGIIRALNGDIAETKINVSVTDGRVYCIKDDTISEINMDKVFSVKIGEDIYFNASGKMMKVLGETPEGAVLEFVEVDTDKLSEAKIGYGITSAVAQTQKVGLLMNMSTDLVNMNYHNALENKGSGEDLPLTYTKYLYVRPLLLRASRAEILGCTMLDREESVQFIKEHKIKWNNVSSLEELIPFIKNQLNEK